jgi:aminocarboxymuconate-semialdehyde decarboxylase
MYAAYCLNPTYYQGRPSQKPATAKRRHQSDPQKSARPVRHVPALRCVIDSLGADRLLLGTDFPYEAGDIFVWAVDYITDPQIADHQAHAILKDNATALLGITTPAGGATS